MLNSRLEFCPGFYKAFLQSIFAISIVLKASSDTRRNRAHFCPLPATITSIFASLLTLQSSNLVYLLGTAALGVKLVAEPLASQAAGQLDADHALAHAQHLGVVALDAALDAEAVVGRHGADALDLVGGNGDTETSAADEQRAVGLALGDEADGGGGARRVGGLVGGLVGADVDDFRYARVGLKVLLDGVLVADAGFLLLRWLAHVLRL